MSILFIGELKLFRALVNVGWCSMKGGSEWLRPGDYFNDVSHTFSVPQDGVEVVKKDILVRGYQKCKSFQQTSSYRLEGTDEKLPVKTK